MCGIIGLISKQGRQVFPELLDAMQNQKHRGFDSFGVHVKKTIKKKRIKEISENHLNGTMGIAQNQLSITGNGMQPFTSKNNELSLVHNGEIYNFLELKKNLGKEFEKKFESSTDSEVIEKFFEKELKKKSVEASVKKFFKQSNGMYAVLFQFKNSLYAFRDPVGIKPLWIGENNSFIGASSEPKPLRKFNILFPQPLLPGHLIEFNEKGFKEKKIFDLTDLKKEIPKKKSFKKLKESFLESIELRTMHLREAAVFFSGGVDSSLIAKAVSEFVPRTTLITVGLQDSPDMKFCEENASELGLNVHFRKINEKDVQFNARKAMYHLPYFDSLQLQIGALNFIAAREAKKLNLKTAFSGQGSDELFCGYSNYKRVLKLNGFKAVEQEIWNQLQEIWQRNLMREDLMSMANTIELRVPFLDLNFIKEAMAFPAKDKIKSVNDELRKHPLRKLAESLGVPKKFSERPKKALQYGSGTGKIVEKMFKDA